MLILALPTVMIFLNLEAIHRKVCQVIMKWKSEPGFQTPKALLNNLKMDEFNNI